MLNTHIRDLYTLDFFKGIQLVAGEGGLDNPIESCGLLDYEYDASVKGKYFHTNFCKKQIVLSSLLYAKDNEFLLDDAVKNLIHRGCSGLIIKNIFKLNIHDSIIRYANTKNFPIFIMKNNNIYFEDVIYQITDLINKQSEVHFHGKQADEIIHSSFTAAEATDKAYRINPSFLSDMVCYFCYFGEELSPSEYFEIISQEGSDSLLTWSDRMFYYKNGIMLIHTEDLLCEASVYAYLEKLRGLLDGYQLHIGISGIHHSLKSIRDAMLQAIYGALLHPDSSAAGHFYDDLGSFKLLVPSYDQDNMQLFSQLYLDPIFEYDVENSINLFDTVTQFVILDGELEPTAERIGQHKNTIRYRLDIVKSLTGANVFSRKGYELISLAVRIWICTQAMSNFGMPPYYWENLMI